LTGVCARMCCCHLSVFRADMLPLAVYGEAREVCSTTLNLGTAAAGIKQGEAFSSRTRGWVNDRTDTTGQYPCIPSAYHACARCLVRLAGVAGVQETCQDNSRQISQQMHTGAMLSQHEGQRTCMSEIEGMRLPVVSVTLCMPLQETEAWVAGVLVTVADCLG
jgi:hypothetical protein